MSALRQGPGFTLNRERLGLFALAALLGLSPLLAGWALLAEGRAASGVRVDFIEVRRLEPKPHVIPAPHLPKGCVLLLRRAKPAPWDFLAERGLGGVHVLRAVRCVHPGVPAWVLKGRALPLDISWPVLGVARRRMELVTTGYDPGPEDNTRGWVDITRMGSRARFGIVAVDPDFIPLGTRVYVEGYGPGLAADVGGAIKGHRMDLCFNSSDQARAWGRRHSRVWIVDPAPRADRPALRRALGPTLSPRTAKPPVL
ncbi:MAG: 3D domain-containing protein [bacterium]